jgi:hypothetical protein
MATKKPLKKIHTWEITLIRERGKLLGHVDAPDEKSAIEEAIQSLPDNPEQQKRLIARRER